MTSLARAFIFSAPGNNTGDFLQFAVCSACKEALTSGKVPVMSVSNGYRYPPKPEPFPALNPVEERIIAPRLPFMSIYRLTHGNGQYGIKGQVVNVPIEGQELVQCLPRNVPDDAVIDVHIKRRFVSKASYRRGLVKKSSVHAWLRHLEQSPLCRHLNIQID
ncbi:hypothetical protein HPB49_004958 [Dermacentor silvarum]|uniref:Uncharacterized protein n=1 Tax=Dermacentor silvarum TaxID=543639 RepID=A0ACB8CJC9_DERSI|nr:hypothetical protein HPB49_004958 [Dermacentor silvarum]